MCAVCTVCTVCAVCTIIIVLILCTSYAVDPLYYNPLNGGTSTISTFFFVSVWYCSVLSDLSFEKPSVIRTFSNIKVPECP